MGLYPQHPAHLVQVHPPAEHRENHPGHGKHKVGNPLAEHFLRNQVGGQEIDFNRATHRAPKRHARHGAEHLQVTLDTVGIDPLVHGNIDERVEEFHFHAQLLGEERVQVRQDRRPSGQQDPRRSRSPLLAAVEVDRAVHFRVQPRDHIAHDLGSTLRHLAVQFRIHAAERHVRVFPLQLLGFFEREPEFPGQLLRDRDAGDGNAATEDARLLHEDQVRGSGPDIENHDAAVLVRVVVAYRVVQRHGCGIHDFRFHANGEHTVREPAHVLDFRRHEHDVHVARVAFHERVVPHDLVDRKRNVLLRLVLDDLGDLVFRHRGKSHEAGEDGLSRNAHDQRRRPDAVLVHYDPYGLARGLRKLVPVAADGRHAVVEKFDAARLGNRELGHHDAAAPHIEGKNAFCRQHGLSVRQSPASGGAGNQRKRIYS